LEVLEDRTLLSAYTVDRLTDLGEGSDLAGDLRYCITHAADGDDITFGVTGTINLTGALPNLTHNISIQGPGPDRLTVRRDTGGNYRIFTIAPSTMVSIDGLTIANGYLYGYSGGAIFNAGTVTVSSSTIAGNMGLGGGNGGGIYNDHGMMTVSNSTISGNSTASVCADNDCYGGNGGGIDNDHGTLSVSNSTFSGNSGGYYGGGGGINNDDGTLTVSNSTFSGNSGNGGGIANEYGTLTVSNSTFSGNFAHSDGGGIFNYNSGMLIVSSTFSGNSALFAGGGIYHFGTLHARNTIIAGNGASDLYGDLGSQGHNLIGNTQGGSGFDPTDLLNVNPLLGPLQDNGGPTFTRALLPGSPAIDAGDNTDAPDWDQRGPGFPRIVGIIDPDNPIIDIGAFEVQQDGGSGPGRSVPLHAKPVHLDVAALLDTRPSQLVSQIASETKPNVAGIDALFGNDPGRESGVVIGQAAMMDDLTPFHTHKESRQDLTEADRFNLFGVFLLD
jgi:hypothetical protein